MENDANKKVTLLNNIDIARKIERIAYEIYEQNFEVDELIFIGIRQQGTNIAKRIKTQLLKIAEIKITGYTVNLNKEEPTLGEIELNKRIEDDSLTDKAIIIFDDVANTGRTLCYAIRPLLDSLPCKIQVAVLVDRQHKKFPIQADFVGYSLSTTLQEHIDVNLTEGQEKVLLR